MLLARAFVLTANARAALAIALVASSVAYALVAGAAVEGLQEASETLGEDLTRPERVAVHEPRALTPGLTQLTSVERDGTAWGTVRPWPYGNASAIPGPYARAPAALPADVTLAAPRQDAHAPWDWVLLPPAVFDREFPELAGRATVTFGAQGEETPAARAFYTEGADQVRAGVHLVVAAMGVTVAALSASIVRLELLAREREVATLEALAGRRVARRVLVLRALALAAAGVLAGILVGLLVTWLAGRALESDAFDLPLSLVAEAGLVTLAGSALAGALAARWSLRAPLPARLGPRGISTRPFPGPVRFLLVTPRVAPSVMVACVILTSISGVVLAAAQLPYELFAAEGDVQVVGQAENNPFRGSASRFFGEHATTLDGVQAASPETIVPTSLRGVPFLARGAHVDAWRALDEPRLLSGGWPDAPGEAAIGWRLARALDIAPGDALVIPGAYRATFAQFTVAGVFRADKLADNELVIPLDDAGSLAALGPERVHMVRLKATDEAFLALASQPLLRVTDMTLVPPNPVPYTEAIVRLQLLNLRDVESTRELPVRVNGIVVASVTARVAPRENATLDVPFTVPGDGSLRIEVNPTLETDTADATLQVVAPARVALGVPFTARVLDEAGAPVANATVRAGNATATTDAAGNATLPAEAEGVLGVAAQTADGRQGGARVVVVDPDLALQPRLRASALALASTSPWNETHVEQRVLATVTNIGGAPFAGPVTVLADGAPAGNTTLRFAPDETRTVELRARAPANATRLVVLGSALALEAEAGEGGARTIEDVLREKAEAVAAGGGAPSQLTGEALVRDVFADLEPAVAIVVLATFAQAGCIVLVAVLRETAERAEVGRLLGSLGASREQVSLRAARDALLASLPGIVVGLLVALVGFLLLGALGFPAAFGHAIPLAPAPGFLLRIGLSLLAVSALTAFWAAPVRTGGRL